MFTGIIEEMGEITAIERGNRSAVLHIRCQRVLEGTKVGDSIAVNGVCLTVTTLDADGYTADVMAETLDRSSLGTLRRGSRVNLERAMPADGRFGGHIVAGHIDGIGRVADVTRDDTAVWYRIAAEPQVSRYIVEKGSITIDGISLTVAGVTGVLADRKAGDIVNLETDIIGKYVEKLMQPEEPVKKESRLTMEFLADHGFS